MSAGTYEVETHDCDFCKGSGDDCYDCRPRKKRKFESFRDLEERETEENE